MSLTSCIDVYIYEVKVQKPLDERQELDFKYSFNKLKKKNENDNDNSFIASKEFYEKLSTYKPISQSLLKTTNKYFVFSKNIIKNTNSNNQINIKNNNIPFLYKIYKTLPARATINNIIKGKNIELNEFTPLKN